MGFPNLKTFTMHSFANELEEGGDSQRSFVLLQILGLMARLHGVRMNSRF